MFLTTKKDINSLGVRGETDITTDFGSVIGGSIPPGRTNIKNKDMNLIYEIIGWSGSFLILLAYFLLSQDKLEETDLKYQSLNIVGALLLGVNAYQKQAWPILFLQLAWILIGIFTIKRLSR